MLCFESNTNSFRYEYLINDNIGIQTMKLHHFIKVDVLKN